MSHPTVVLTDHGFVNVDTEREILAASGAILEEHQCTTRAEVLGAAREADALLVQWAPVDRSVIDRLERCKIIVRYGIGVDNVDLAAAKRNGIPVCNVPDYCIDEVADHTMAHALCLARHLPSTHRRIGDGVWRIVPDRPMPAFRDMTFATMGFGRIAREVLKRAAGFGFRLAASDPHVDDETFVRHGVDRLSQEELVREADILSLHAPLTPATKHVIDAETLRTMKDGAILINTSRGELIDSLALADALQNGVLAAAGLDVFETEPLPEDHPLRSAPHVLLSSHMAWYSEASVPRLQRLAAEEVVRGLLGKPLNNRVNP